MFAFRAMQAADACFEDLLKRASGEQAKQLRMRWLRAQGKDAEALAELEHLQETSPFDKANLLFNLGRYEEAEVQFRKAFEQDGLTLDEFKTPPVATSPYVGDQLYVGALRLLQGEREAGLTLLEEAARRAAASPVGSGDFARGWNDVVALALLGRHEAACAAYAASVKAGLVTYYDFAEGAPDLAEFRAQPCYSRVVAIARQRAEAEIEKARAANLLPG